MLTKEQLIRKEKYVVKDLNGEVIETFRYMGTISNYLSKWKNFMEN